MINKLEINFEEYQELKKYLDGLPEDIWDILIPSDEKDYKAFMSEIKYCRANEETKTHIMRIQRQFDLPLRPNETIRKTVKKVRIKVLRDKNKNTKNWE